MPPKAKLPAPIDRPLSRAYLRQFLGWSTEYPPGMSQPNSLRVMENMMIARDGSVKVRPGLRYLSYDGAEAGKAVTRLGDLTAVVGSHEPFFLNDGRKAYLFAVKLTNSTVGFRVAIAPGDNGEPFKTVTTSHADVGIGFVTPFTAATTYVRYLQIDNKIIALSNAGEPPKVFYVGATKKVVTPQTIPTPIWSYLHKPIVRHARKIAIDDPDTFPPLNNASTPTTKTLAVTGAELADDTKSFYNIGYYYTFSNEFGESLPSQVTVVKVRRPWAAWKWETPTSGVSAEPSGTETTNDDVVADQLFIYAPQAAFDPAGDAGATHVNYYAIMWSDQGTVPVEGSLIYQREIEFENNYVKNWGKHTPQPYDILRTTPVPTFYNRYNASDPTTAGQGIVAADRMVMVYDPNRAAVIKWTSNQLGENLNFSTNRGGGYKTLTSGNMYVPAVVKLWQNPQSADTLTILCLGIDGQSTAYYMAPAQVASQSDSQNIMGFEETTATPGTVSPYGCEVLNNSLYHPMENALVKSTASNYNINHKDMTDLIRAKWIKLINKQRIVASHHENRLYYLVHNPEGELLNAGNWGNEIWVCDTAAKDAGTWSRWLVQGNSLRKLEVDGKVMMSVTGVDGIFCFDEDLQHDEYVTDLHNINSRPIPWKFETNTQGANRAHDAWAHLQQLTLTLGNFVGSMRYGINGYDINGKVVDVSKIVHAPPGLDASLPWDFDDHLQVRRQMKEWRFFAEAYIPEGSNDDSSCQVSLVQYRYTPITVNVGYEYGSVETFEYGRDAVQVEGTPTTNGIPQPMVDTRRP